MILDGDKLAVQDRIYHLTMGYGVVETLEKGVARVRMSNGGDIVNMGENGMVMGNKVFFWYEPRFLIPKKGYETKHATAIELTNKIIELGDI